MITYAVQLLCAFSKSGEDVVYADRPYAALCGRFCLGKHCCSMLLLLKCSPQVKIFPLLSYNILPCKLSAVVTNAQCGIVQIKLRLRTVQTHKS